LSETWARVTWGNLLLIIDFYWTQLDSNAKNSILMFVWLKLDVELNFIEELVPNRL
jgi:hypothetical protein